MEFLRIIPKFSFWFFFRLDSLRLGIARYGQLLRPLCLTLGLVDE
jgi:hypothetical protein